MSTITPQTILLLLLLLATAAHSDPSQRIVNGHDAPEHSAPYQISLQTLPGDHMCGGAIIDNQWIVTAGHCASGWPADRLRVAVGSNRHQEPAAVYYVEAVYVHCRYNEPRYHNDIALLHLSEPIQFDDHIGAVKLPLDGALEGEHLRLTGWGSLTLWGAMPETLQELDLQLVERSNCASLLEEFDDVQLDLGLLCAFGQREQGACHGDSGGPLVNEEGELRGLLSWYSPCAQGVPDLYTNVLYYRDWMRQVMSGNKRCKSHVPGLV